MKFGFVVCAVFLFTLSWSAPIDNAILPVEKEGPTSPTTATKDLMDGGVRANTPTETAPTKPLLPTIAVVIPTMRRFAKDHSPAPEHYLKPLVMGISHSLTEEQRQAVHLTLMNVDKEPEQHKELLELMPTVGMNATMQNKDKGQFVDMSKFIAPEGDGMFNDVQGRHITGDTLNWRAGETMDAPKLWLAASKQADYVLFLEDDVTPTSNVMTKIYSFLEKMKAEGKDDFLMADLYTPAIAWGPQTANNMEIYDYECCTQAMLFKSSHVADLANYEFDHPERPVDDNIRDYVRQDPNNRKVYAMVPNPFEHVGGYSSNPEKSTGTVEHRSLFFEQ